VREYGHRRGNDHPRIAPGTQWRATETLPIGGANALAAEGKRVSTIPYLAALGLALLGVVLLAVGARGPWQAAIGGGVAIGLAAATVLVTRDLRPLGPQTPAAIVLLGLLVGLAAAYAGRWRRREGNGQRSGGAGG
jgi:hypothetical protein